MIENNNFPWYLQLSPTFKTLYDGFFNVAVDASPLGIGDAFNIDEMTGLMLFRLGTYWGMTGSPYVWDGLIYNIDKWSETKTWTGGLKEVGTKLYANMIKAKAYAYGRVYCLETLKGVFERLFDGYEYTITIQETGSMFDNSIDEGLVNENVEDTEDLGSVTDTPASDSIDCGSLASVQFDINKIIINLTTSQEVIQSFIEMRGFDLSFIGRPTGIQVLWNYITIN